MDPILGGALLSAGGRLLGGIFGQNNQAATQGDVTAREMRAKIETGKEFGLHPLAAIGAQTSGYAGNYLGDALGDAAGALGEGYAKARDPLSKKQGELIDAQVEEARSRTLLNKAEAASRIRASMDPHGPGSGPQAPGIQRTPLIQRVDSPDGKHGYGLNPDAFEIGLGELLTGLVFYGPQFVYQWGEDAWKYMQSHQGPKTAPRPRTTTRGMKRRAPWEH